MKKLLLSFLFFLLILSVSYSQTNSVLLKTGTGTLISSHNTIQAAYNAITGPITSAYLIEITAPYTGAEEAFPISFTAIGGASETNTITVRPAAGNTGEVISATVSGTGGVPVIFFNGAQYVYLDGRPGGTGTAADLKIENLSTASTAYTIKLTNSASYNKIMYCNTTNLTNATAGGRNIAFEATPTGAMLNNLVANCVIDGGRSTIGLISAGTGPIPTDGTVIQNCVIKNWGYAAIWYLGGASNTTVTGSELYQNIASTSTIQTAFQLAAAGCGGTTIISNNRIYNLLGTASAVAPRAISGSIAAGGTIKIFNNFISMPLDNGTAPTIYAINLLGTTDYNVEIIYNSIYIGGVHTGGTSGAVLSAGIVKGSTGAAGSWIQKNNIVVNKRTGGTSGGVHTTSFFSTASLVGTLDVNYNNYYSFGDPGSYHAGWSSVVYNDIALYKAAATPNEQNSKFYDVNFVSNTNLHLAGNSVGDFQLAGIPFEGITKDIDGQNRSVNYPYKGADEGDIPLPVELISFNAAVDRNNVNLFWTTASEINNAGFQIERSRDYITWQSISYVEGKGTTTQKSVYTYTDKNVPQGKYTYRLKQVDLNGSASYHLLNRYVEVIGVNIYNLSQNYPNPFNPTTSISYSIAQSELVTLKVYDVIGNEVAVLVNEEKAPGSYNMELNAGKLSSGIYFYKLTAGKFTSVKKMTILK